MKRKKLCLLLGLVLLLFLLCTACGNTEGQIAPQDDPNEGLGGGLSEDTVNDFTGFEGIWLGEADNEYDSMEFDAEGTGPSIAAVKWWMTAIFAMSRNGRLSMPTATRMIPAASSPWRTASSTVPPTATLIPVRG